jgi:hypothetical protein
MHSNLALPKTITTYINQQTLLDKSGFLATTMLDGVTPT